MNYHRLAEIDGELAEIMNELYWLKGASGGILHGEIKFETNSTPMLAMTAWRTKTFAFEIVREHLIDKLNKKYTHLRKEHKRLVGPWYKRVFLPPV